jgi:Na+-translocating ferredoxin:NAD+ oxidoreductase RnfA subunit
LRRYRRLRASICLLGLATLIVAVVYQRAFPGGLIVVLPLGGLPLLGYLAWVRSKAGSIGAGVALLVLFVATALSVTAWLEAGSDTAPLGYLYLSLLGLPILLVTLFVEMLVRNRRPQSAP